MGQAGRMAHTVVLFHAHPDDEALLTAGTMAKASAEGHRVVLVVATRGEVGEADRALLDDSGELGDLRTDELLASAHVLGVDRVEFLGYRDSGSGPGSGPSSGDTFAAASIDEAAGRLAAILQDEQADVLTTYDPAGGYGHPDHVRVHQVGRAAAALAGTPVVLEATISRGLLQMALDLLPTLGYSLPDDFVPPDVSTVYTADEDLTHAIDVSAHLAQKRASMEAHTSQTTSSTTTTRTLAIFLQLPDELFALAFGTEWFVDRSATPGERHTDLFATVPQAARD